VGLALYKLGETGQAGRFGGVVETRGEGERDIEGEDNLGEDMEDTLGEGIENTLGDWMEDTLGEGIAGETLGEGIERDTLGEGIEEQNTVGGEIVTSGEDMEAREDAGIRDLSFLLFTLALKLLSIVSFRGRLEALIGAGRLEYFKEELRKEFPPNTELSVKVWRSDFTLFMGLGTDRFSVCESMKDFGGGTFSFFLGRYL